MKKKFLALFLGAALIGGSSLAVFAANDTKSDTKTNVKSCCEQKAACCVEKAACCK